MSELTAHTHEPPSLPEGAPTPLPHEADVPFAGTVDWQRHSEDVASVVITEPEVGHVTGTLHRYEQPQGSSIYVDMFVADSPGNGGGKRLLELLKQQGLKYGATRMGGHFTSQASLGAFLRVTEGSDLVFRRRYGKEPVDISAEEALTAPSDYIAWATIAEGR